MRTGISLGDVPLFIGGLVSVVDCWLMDVYNNKQSTTNTGPLIDNDTFLYAQITLMQYGTYKETTIPIHHGIY